jgi:hypothetical protein
MNFIRQGGSNQCDFLLLCEPSQMTQKDSI